MPTSTGNPPDQVRAADVAFDGELLRVVLSDGREVGLPYTRVPSLRWLAGATATQREDWSIEPGGFAIHWNTLDDGVEVAHLLRLEPIA